MGYDFHVGLKNRNEFCLTLEENIHSSLFSFISTEDLSLPYLSKLEDYYKDSRFRNSDIPRLILELNQLQNNPKLSKVVVLWLKHFEALAIKSGKDDFDIFGFCD